MDLKLIIFTTLLSCSLSLISFADEIKATGGVEISFSPKAAATETIVKEINQAKSEIMVQKYFFTSAPIAKALTEAKEKGITVKVFPDKIPQKSKNAAATAGVPPNIDLERIIDYNKSIIIDRKTLITGSFNFSKPANGINAENLLIARGNQALIEKYIKSFEKQKGHSAESQGK